MQILIRIVIGFFRFWYDFIIGDAWEIAAGVAIALIAGIILLRREVLPESVLPYLIGGVVILVVTLSVLQEYRKKARVS